MLAEGEAGVEEPQEEGEEKEKKEVDPVPSITPFFKSWVFQKIRSRLEEKRQEELKRVEKLRSSFRDLLRKKDIRDTETYDEVRELGMSVS